MENEVKICKLVSGELLIGEFTEDGSNYDIKNPMHIMFQPGQAENQIGIGLIQYIPFMGKNSSIQIGIDKVLCWINEFPAEIMSQFQGSTSGIVVPPKPDLKLVVGNKT